MGSNEPPTKPRLIFESSWGICIQYGDERVTEIEMLEGFMSEHLLFGDPPYRIEVEAVPIAESPPTIERFRRFLSHQEGENRGSHE